MSARDRAEFVHANNLAAQCAEMAQEFGDAAKLLTDAETVSRGSRSNTGIQLHAATLAALGELERLKGNYRAAAALGERALEELNWIFPREPLAEAQNLLMLSRAYRFTGNFHGAESSALEALRRLASLERRHDALEGEVCLSLARLYSEYPGLAATNTTVGSSKWAEKARDHFDADGHAPIHLIVEAKITAAEGLDAGRKIKELTSLRRDVAAIKSPGLRRDLDAKILLFLSGAYLNETRNDDAESNARELLSLALGPDMQGQAGMVLCMALQGQGRNYEARAAGYEAIKVLRSKGMTALQDRAADLAAECIFKTYVAKSQWSDAARVFKEHENAFLVMDRPRHIVWQVAGNLARLRSGDPLAKQRLRNVALVYSLAIDRMDFSTATYTQQESAPALRELAELSIHDDDAYAFTVSEFVRSGLVFATARKRTISGLLNSIPEDMRDWYRQKEVLLEGLYRPDSFTLSDEFPPAIAATQAMAVQSASAAVRAWGYARYPMTLAPDQVVLRTGEVGLEYLVGSNGMYLFVLRPGNPSVAASPARLEKVVQLMHVDRGAASKVALTEKSLGDEIERYKPGSPPVLADLTVGQGADLYATLLGPADLDPSRDKSLLVSPDGRLSELAFEALIADTGGCKRNALLARSAGSGGYSRSVPFADRCERLRFVDDLYSVTTMPSFRVLAWNRDIWPAALRELRRENEPVATSVVIADPIFASDVGDPRCPKECGDLQTRNNRSLPPLSRVPTTAEELRRTVAVFKAARIGVSEFEGRGATETAFWTAVHDHAPWSVHFSTHGNLDGFPYLVLTSPRRNGTTDESGDKSFENDGKIDVREVLAGAGNFDGTELVSLETCHSAKGPLLPGEGQLSLAHAFLARGAQRVVGSRWGLYDTTAEQFGPHALALALTGIRFGDALRYARAEIRKAQGPHPFFWAGLGLFGDDGALRIPAGATSLSRKQVDAFHEAERSPSGRHTSGTGVALLLLGGVGAAAAMRRITLRLRRGCKHEQKTENRAPRD